ncbi:hypothetical protein [Bradyrhizobium sp. S69]|uniref:hypothetical protein n=1 Tax=Bradyrhizobium sp. S69 TaxID=1641856 RepID=UPI00131E3C75|nr:hypothetical protein [Bradyrhizobium sp. S69]
MRPSLRSNHFILEAFDRDLWCPIAQTLFHAADIAALRAILEEDANDDPELRHCYHLDNHQLAALAARFGVKFDRSEFASADLVIGLFRWHPLSEAPYLIHTGYELPLLLDGRKKLARMIHEYPPMTFDGEHRFDHWVAEGLLHREEVIEPFDAPTKGYLGLRTVFYTPKGEEWRIPARELIWRGCRKGWNEHFERLEGMLFGYEDWQNDWWIDQKSQRGAFGGLLLCCPVTAAGLAWMETAGFRALPPVEGPAFVIASYDADEKDQLDALMREGLDRVAVARFNVGGRDVMDFIDLRHAGPWHVSGERIRDLNRSLLGPVVIVARRHDLVSSERA